MKRFGFPLERVRRWRAEQASVEDLKLGQLLAEKAWLQASKRQVEWEGRQSELQVLGQPALEASELHHLDSYRLHIQSRVRELENRQRECEAQVVAQRQCVLEARRRFELLDRLRHKALKEWRAAGNKEQEDLAAELFLAKSRRNT